MRVVRVPLAIVASVIVTGGVFLIFFVTRPSPADVDDPTCWIVHYQRGLNDSAFTAYKDMLQSMHDESELVVAVTNERDEEFVRAQFKADGRLHVVRVRSPLSPWARDRYTLVERDGRWNCLVAPARSVKPTQRGDTEVPEALRRLYPDLTVIESPLVPEGGDTIVTEDAVLVGQSSIRQIATRENIAADELKGELSRLFGRRLVVVGEHGPGLPTLHIDMFLAYAGRGRMVVADPRLAAKGFRGGARTTEIGRFSLGENERCAYQLDFVARQLSDLGYAVVRITGLFAGHVSPEVPPLDLVYTNVIVEGRTVFLPWYRVPDLDSSAQKTWEALGFICKPVRVRGTILNGGAVRCLTNGMRRDRAIRS